CCRKVITRDFQWPHATVSHKHYRLMTTLYNRRAGRSIFSILILSPAGFKAFQNLVDGVAHIVAVQSYHKLIR
ncbi:MAG: hypothetical protein OEV87_09430, partial [Phycisphaerae bacterium]|nr:hypothetical protein [Phycisphaerae bacterium]